MLNCRSCGVVTRVLETRGSGDWIARRRECMGCKARVTTLEVVRDGLELVRQAQVPVPRVRVAKVKVDDGKSRNDVPGVKVRAAARRRLEDLKDLSEIEGEDFSISADDLRREMGW